MKNKLLKLKNLSIKEINERIEYESQDSNKIIVNKIKKIIKFKLNINLFNFICDFFIYFIIFYSIIMEKTHKLTKDFILKFL